jgi:aminoglycoside 3-N-acetyltransferase I
MRSLRLTTGDRARAQALFKLMAEVFEEEHRELGDAYLDRLLGRQDFWAIAAFDGDEIIGGLTAHTLPMTSAETSEIFIYDLAVHGRHQRRGVGRHLVAHLRRAAAALGLGDVFVPADNHDTHALDFYRAVGGAAAAVTIFTFPRSRDDG